MTTVETAAPSVPTSTFGQIEPIRRFQPSLTHGHIGEIMALGIEMISRPLSERVRYLREAIEAVELRRRDLLALGVARRQLLPTVKYLAALRVLRDLVQQGWTLRMDDEGIYLQPALEVSTPPSGPEEVKQALRRSFSFARSAQLKEPATRAFIETMERRGVGQLFARGSELAQRLEVASTEPGGLEAAIRPSLHLIDSEATDERFGLRLRDIWRYARHYWSIPYQTTPGRNLFYLVRDDAGPNRPVIGIAALGNAVLGLAQRDDALGWSASSLRRRLLNATANSRLAIGTHLVSVLRSDVQDVYAEDLPVDAGPWTTLTVARLREAESNAAFSRRHSLAVAGEERSPDYQLIKGAHDDALDGDPDEVDWLTVAQTDLYRRKRAGTLANLIQACITLDAWQVDERPEALLAALEDERARAACEVALRRIKQRAITENVMEIITCGAVPPYGEVLGGKLVAMLLTSPRVAKDVADRYAGRVSLIASGLKGQAVVRRPALTVLTTSSLYSVGSSQYNRIRIPATAVGEGCGQVSYDRIGKTDSFGTVQFAPDTADVLVDLGRLDDGDRRLVNHLFGEGMSPKMRALRSGLEALGLEPEKFLKHHSPRLLYAARLAHNTDNVLFGLENEPDYIQQPIDGADGVEELIAYWRTRWLAPRLTNSEVVARLHGRHDVPLLSAETIDDDTRKGVAVADDRGGEAAPIASSSEFIERLYRSSNSYADRLSAEELEWVDVDLGLNEHIRELADAGRQIIITGNPGDGKTHLIERLRPHLEKAGALVLTDANVLSDEDILAKWRECDHRRQAMVLAINEWPLFVLRRHSLATDFQPLTEALRQVQQAITYSEKPIAGPVGPVRVIDLSLRNVLAASIVYKVIDRLTDERFYKDLSPSDPAVINRNAMRQGRVKERIAMLLDEVARRGYHATMRQLVGFIAFLITGGTKAVDRLASQGSQSYHYAQLAFDPEGGVGPLFDAVRATFDPARVTHPRLDMDLWRGVTAPEDWLDGIRPIAIQHLQPRDRLREYGPLKRRFFFEHRAGGQLVSLLPIDERRFDDLVKGGHTGSATVVRDLLLAINRFYEPDCPDTDRERLVLWQSHRFDVKAPDTFLSLHEVHHGQFEIRPPRLALWVTAWLPQEQRLTQAFALVAANEHASTSASLLVDRALYLTLSEAHWGLGRASWSRSATRRVTRFVDQVHGNITPSRSDVVDVRIRNVAKDIEATFEIQRHPARYRL
ncbi:Druantia anti-phage system protein DruA [Verrucosispora sp. NA02020]|uniref:Druantia anti-phage system protein DruA n=1 Tax=Verrucosispora sp. NA02020 TaxID=2742132 RepID=UPI003D726AD0